MYPKPRYGKSGNIESRPALLDGALFLDSITSRPKWNSDHDPNHIQRGFLEEIQSLPTGETSLCRPGDGDLGFGIPVLAVSGCHGCRADAVAMHARLALDRPVPQNGCD